MKKILTIIVPAFNMEDWLGNCCGSLVLSAERMALLDVAVVDDGSSDRTGEIARSFAARFPDVFRTITKPNGHYGSCVNAVLATPCGEYVKMLDADDSFDADALSRLLAFLAGRLESGNPPDLVVTPFARVGRDGATIDVQTFRLPANRDFGIAELADSVENITTHALAYRRGVLEGYRQTEGVNYTDNEWCFAPMAKVERASYLQDAAVYRYLVDREGQSMSFESLGRNFGDRFRLLREMSALRGKTVCDGAHARYLDAWLARFGELGYMVAVRHAPFGEAARLFGEWDALVKECLPAFFGDMGNVPFSSRLKWRYIGGLRRHAKIRGALIALLRLYVRAAAAAGR